MKVVARHQVAAYVVLAADHVVGQALGQSALTVPRGIPVSSALARPTTHIGTPGTIGRRRRSPATFA